MIEARTHPFEQRRAAVTGSRARLANLAVPSGTSPGEVIDLLTREPVRSPSRRGARGTVVDLTDRGAPAYRSTRDHLARQILATATPDRSDRLFPGPSGDAAVTFGRGAAGVLWALAESGVEVPVELVDWLERSAARLDPRRPGLFDGASGVALTLSRLGRSDAAEELWRAVDAAPLGPLDVSVARGLPGLGLALLERAPILDESTLMDRLASIAGELTVRLGAGRHGAGVLRGGAGAALFLLDLYEVSEDESLLAPIEVALLHDLALLGWGPLSDASAAPLWWQEPLLGNGSAGLAMVLREAAGHLDAGWLGDAQEWIATACECYVPVRPGLLDGAAGTAVALWHLRRTPWDTAVQRRALMRPHLERLGLVGGPALDVARTGVDLSSGAAGILVALETLMGPEERRVPFFW